MGRAVRIARPFLFLALLLTAPVRMPAAQSAYVNGVFVGTSQGPLELTAWAEPTRSGELRMARGELSNVPAVTAITRILCNLPNWKPTAVFLASQEIFRDDRAERRQLPLAIRVLNVSAIEIRVQDLESAARIRELRKSVRASETAPAYFFVVMATNGLERYYPARLDVE
jgi:hypothetical protein